MRLFFGLTHFRGCMTVAVLRHMGSLIGIDQLPVTSPGDNEIINWEFGKELAKQPATFFHPMISKHLELNVTYSVLCTRLLHDFSRPGVSKAELVEQLVAALMMAELLTPLYRDFLGEWHEVARLQDDKKVFRDLLATQNYSFGASEDKAIALSAWSGQRVRGATPNWNFPRLMFGRSRRLFTTLVPIIKDFEFVRDYLIESKLGRKVAAVDPYLGVIVSHASWLFFAPRLTVNSIVLLSFIVPSWWTAAKEKKMGLWLGFLGQLQQRWFELGNDSLWMTSGLLNCFVLTGPLAPLGIYVTLSLFLFDVLWARLRARIEHNRLTGQQKVYDDMALEIGGEETKEWLELKSYREHFAQRVEFEDRRLFVTLVNTQTLMFGMCFAFPAFAASPLLPFLGALIVLTTTFMVNRHLQALGQLRPVDRVIALNDKSGKSIYETGLTLFRPSEPTEPPHDDRLREDDSIQMGKSDHRGLHHSKSAPGFLETKPLAKSDPVILPFTSNTAFV
ncbi:hypothetical protein [Legionella donaldsonii]|nr:hypothetical protein [Legionella donaldsonii]